MNQTKINTILEKHKKWVNKEEGGERADILGANLQGADLRNADLRDAVLRRADLQGANLQGADLRNADLRNADLRDADLDFACWPLWCGSFDAKCDERLFSQLAYHMCRLDVPDELKPYQNMLIPLANKFHRAQECGILSLKKDDEP